MRFCCRGCDPGAVMPEALPRGGRCVLRSASKPRVRRGQLLLSAEPFVYLLKDVCVRDRCCYCLERWAGRCCVVDLVGVSAVL